VGLRSGTFDPNAGNVHLSSSRRVFTPNAAEVVGFLRESGLEIAQPIEIARNCRRYQKRVISVASGLEVARAPKFQAGNPVGSLGVTPTKRFSDPLPGIFDPNISFSRNT
jgi:hypothetical protein